ncbi:MAG: hypothetical protein ACI9M9_001601 [Flavobacteriaceae bacterium]|jgi:hypothetical protein
MKFQFLDFKISVDFDSALQLSKNKAIYDHIFINYTGNTKLYKRKQLLCHK